MSPELKTIMDTLRSFQDTDEAKTWLYENRPSIIPILADLTNDALNVIVEDIGNLFKGKNKGFIIKELKLHVKAERESRVAARNRNHFKEDINFESSKDGKVIATVVNISKVLLNSKYILLRHDEFTGMELYEVYNEYQLPWQSSNSFFEMNYKVEHREKEVNSVKYFPAPGAYEVAALKHYLQTFFEGELNWKMLREAIIYAARQNQINICQDYINNGLPEYDFNDHMDILHRYAGVKNREWAITVMHSIMLGMMARVYSPGFNYRGTVVLVGEENLGKSVFTEMLSIHKRFYLQFTFGKNTSEDEVGRKLESRLVVELPDTGGIGAKNDNYIKAFLTATSDSFRRMRQDLVESIDRNCVFIVTTNTMEAYLGKSGTTRFMPCEVFSFDFDGIAKEIPQLFAQSKYLWDMGITPRLTEVELELQQKMVSQHEVKPNWFYLLLNKLKLENFSSYFIPDDNGYDTGISITEILEWFKGNTVDHGWYSNDKESRYRKEIIDVLNRYFFIKSVVKNVPLLKRKIIDKPESSRSYRYIGEMPWADFIKSLED